MAIAKPASSFQYFPAYTGGVVPLTELGYFQNRVFTTASTLAQLNAAAVTPLANIAALLAGTAKMALIYVESTQGIRWVGDGQAPTATYGHFVSGNEAFQYIGNLAGIQLIPVIGTGIVNVSFYA